MNAATFKMQIGLILIASNCFIIFFVIGLYLLGGLLFNEMTTLVIMLLPFLSILVTVVFREFDLQKEPHIEQKVISTESLKTAYIIPSLFVLFAITLILFKSFNIGFSSFEQFKMVFGVSEVIFGIYVAQILIYVTKRVEVQPLEIKENMLLVELKDFELQERCLPPETTDSKSWDSAIRTAGVILEERLRKLSAITNEKASGIEFVNELFGKKSALAAKYVGYRSLYEGIISTLRNPYAHRLVDPTPEDAKASIVFVDLLLRMLEDLQIDDTAIK